jgi:hypothetical protein
MDELTAAAGTPTDSVPLCAAEKQFRVLSALPTVRVSVQLSPPIFMAKVAVPTPEGVPVMEYVKLPVPTANTPGSKVAVKPVTPVEATV